jgi:hypothetical protein
MAMWMCGGQAPLGFDGGEVLDVVAQEAAQVLDEPVEQRREVQRIPRRPEVVIGGRVGGGAVAAHAPVAGAGEGDEHRGPERLAVPGFVGFAESPRGDLPAGQVRGVLAAPGGSVTADRLGGQHVAAHPRPGDLLVQVPDRRVVLSGVLAAGVGLVAATLGIGAQLDPHALFVVGVVGLDDGLVVEVPAFAALRRTQGLGPVGAGGTDRGEGVPAGNEHGLGTAGFQVGAA